MKAEEARKLASSLNTNAGSKQLKEIEEIIKSAAEKGDFKTYYYETIITSVWNKLREDGYKLEEFHDFREGTTITISW